MRSTLIFPLAVCASVFASCANSPAARSPLRDKLAAADTPDVISATRDCLSKNGWNVDPVGSVSSTGADVVAATKDKDHTNVAIHSKDVVPRITDGPDGSDPFWKCLATSLGGGGGSGGGGETPAGSASSEGASTPSPDHS
jgi:hypothetical protein